MEQKPLMELVPMKVVQMAVVVGDPILMGKLEIPVVVIQVIALQNQVEVLIPMELVIMVIMATALVAMEQIVMEQIVMGLLFN